MIKSAVVILNWNGLSFLKMFLEDLYVKTATEDCRVYLADNGSTDRSVEWTAENLPGVGIIRMKENLGFAGGYVRALENLDAEYYVLINSDIEVTDGWLEPVINYLDINPDIAACQPKILDWNNKERFEYAGAAGGYIDKFGYPFCRGRIMSHIEADNGQYNDQQDIFWATGACLIIRSIVWKESGGFDTDFFAHMEEIDLCWRIHKLGYRITCFPDSVIYHVGGGTLPYDSPNKLFYNFRNNLFLLHKNLPGKNYRTIIFKRMLLDGIAGIRFIMMFQIKQALVIFRSHLAYYRAKNELDKKRTSNLEGKNHHHGDLILNKSIVYAFFIKGRKTFDAIWPSKGKE